MREREGGVGWGGREIHSSNPETDAVTCAASNGDVMKSIDIGQLLTGGSHDCN